MNNPSVDAGQVKRQRPVAVPLAFVLLMASPLVQACSLAGSVPEQAYFFLWDGRSEDVMEIAVKERNLGADCSLSNPFAYDGERFVWLSPFEDGDAIHIHEPDGSSFLLGFDPTGDSMRDLSLVDDHLFFLTEDYRNDTFFLDRFDLQDGTAETLELGVRGSRHMRLDGDILVELNEEAHTVQRTDAHTGASESFALPAELQEDLTTYYLAMDSEWLAYTTGGGPDDDPWTLHVIHIETGRTDHFDMPGPLRHRVAIDDGMFYGGSYEEDEPPLFAMDLETGSVEVLGAPGAPFLGAASNGTMVFGAYSIHDDNGEWTAPSGESVHRSTPMVPIPSVAVLGPLSVLVVASIVMGPRRRP